MLTHRLGHTFPLSFWITGGLGSSTDKAPTPESETLGITSYSILVVVPTATILLYSKNMSDSALQLPHRVPGWAHARLVCLSYEVGAGNHSPEGCSKAPVPPGSHLSLLKFLSESETLVFQKSWGGCLFYSAGHCLSTTGLDFSAVCLA